VKLKQAIKVCSFIS